MYPHPRLCSDHLASSLPSQAFPKPQGEDSPLDPQTQASPQGSLPGTMGLGVGLLQLMVLELPSTQQKTHL